jgi:hypothetical protein
MKNDLNRHDVPDTDLAIHDAEFLLSGIDNAFNSPLIKRQSLAD